MKPDTSSLMMFATISCPLLLALLNLCLIYALQSDVDCLKSIKASLEDPLDSLHSWNFNNNTEGFICNFVGIECRQPPENTVLNIRLSGMGLKGQFPPGLESCSSLTGVDLSRNQINGTIPSDVSKIIGELTTLDLSYNQLSGEIPVNMGNCVYLNVLKLNNNNLTGKIPPELFWLDSIKDFNVANNRLTGPIPFFENHVSFPAENYENNEGLCGDPLEPCNHVDVARKDHSHRDLFVSGFGTGWAIFTLLALYICFYGFPYAEISGILFGKKIKVNSTSACPDEQKKILKLEKFVSRMSFRELERATTNFREDSVIGYGSLGIVYKALLPNGYLLAIKRLKLSDNLYEEFFSEIMTLGRLRHQNLVPLIGFCSERKEKLVVYKYMWNGSLREWLHSTEDKAKALTWPLRMKIAVGVAKALSWLHYGCRLNVVHNGLSSKCILLDHNFEPRISKFWEATIMNTNDLGSSWSVSANHSECADNFSPYTKDVYCFGIVLLELITRKEAYELSCSTSSTTSPLDVDNSIRPCQGFDNSISQFLEIAKNCVKLLPNQRPTMLQVHESLSSIAQSCLVNSGSEISFDCT